MVRKLYQEDNMARKIHLNDLRTYCQRRPLMTAVVANAADTLIFNKVTPFYVSRTAIALA